MNRESDNASRPGRLARRVPATGSQVAAACKQIARLIAREGLQVGDKLPSQPELRRTLGFSNCSLDPAMEHLVDLGLITRRPRHGTVICDLEPLNRLTWSFGIATIDEPSRGPGAATAWLLHAMQRQIARRHSSCHVYFRDDNPRWPHRIADFPGLAENVEAGEIDGLIVPYDMDAEAIARTGIPAVEMGFVTSAIPFAILEDYPAMISEAAVRLLDRKVRRIALIGREIKHKTFEEVLRQAAGGNGKNGVATEAMYCYSSLEAGAEVARTLLQRPAARRPDALIFTDDFAAVGAVQTLAAQPDYRPGLASMANKQLPQSWALPVIRFEVDLDDMAARTVGLLAEAMLNPEMPPRQEKVQARVAVNGGQ